MTELAYAFRFTTEAVMSVNGQQWNVDALASYIPTIQRRLASAKLPKDRDVLASSGMLAQIFGPIMRPSADFRTFIDNKRNIACSLFGAAGQMMEMLERGPKPDPVAVFSSFTSSAWQLFMFSNIAAGNARRFRVREPITRILASTDVRVPGDSIELPFAFMVVELPDRMFELHDQQFTTYCTHLIITKQTLRFLDHPDGIPMLNVMHLGALTDEIPAGIVSVQSIELDEKPFAEKLDTWIEKPGASMLQGFMAGVSANTATSRSDNSILIAFAANVALYCTNRTSDIVRDNQDTLDRLQQLAASRAKGKKRKNAYERLDSARKNTIYVIGDSFEAKDPNVAAMLDQGRQLNVKHMVRGHWKMQAHGAGMQERKHIFVQPYWRGPDLAEVVNRDYTV